MGWSISEWVGILPGMMKLLNNRIVYVSLVLLGVAAGCSSDPVNVEGSYSVAITNGDNGCDFVGFTEGNTAQNIGITVTQAGSEAQAEVSGSIASGLLDIVLGSHTFEGTVDGADLDLKIIGGTPFTQGENCAYTINAAVHASLDGDVLIGTIDYTAKTNENPDCGSKTTCKTTQSFNGTRPPSK